MKNDDSQITVELGDRRYPVLMRAHATAELVDRVRALCRTRRALLVSDETVAPLYAAPLADALRAVGVDATLATFPAGEAHKHLGTVAALYDAAFGAGVDRSTPVVGVGGGVVGDVAGFLASTLLRGVPYVAVPTTVIAQVDSSVGGKTGVNHPTGKNLIGTFYQPRLVFADVATLATLPVREVSSGLAEAVKHGALASPALLARVEADAARLLAREPDALRPVIAEAVAIKASVVAADEREADQRALLNLGHTLGHAIEAEAGYGTETHGAAVARGMAFAARLSEARGWLSTAERLRLEAILTACGLPTDWSTWIRPSVLARLGADKKAQRDVVRFVLLRALGEGVVVPLDLEALGREAVALATESPAVQRRR